MTLIPGTRLGPFEIIALVGAGGMGEVYRARDTRLGRDVALKVLPDLFAKDADRLSRFQREAQLLACLNHPNIAAIHGLEDAGGVRALVLELVHGETLADRLQRGPMPVAEVVAAARQIADALEAAHEQGVIHRDLKPANVKISPDGNIKVLDFGLAKALESVPAASQLTHSPTLSLAGTFAGVILGTAAYMSPEQAKGLPADQRSDIFSFGCVVFEMLTGRQAFQADTATEMLAAVLMREPDLQTLPADIHPRLSDLVRRCLDKNPRRRWQAVGDIRYELDAIAADPAGVAARASSIAAPSVSTAAAPRWRRAVPIVVAAAVGAAGAAAAMWWAGRSTTPLEVARFSVQIPDDMVFLRPSVGAPLLALSPDGTKLVFQSNRQLYVRSMAEMDARVIPGTNSDPSNPIFSPDGEWIVFYALGEKALKKIAVTGGAPLTLCNAENVYGAHWLGDQIVFAQVGKGIMRVSANGGEPEVIAATTGSETPFGPQLIDNGRHVLFTVAVEAGPQRWDKALTVVQTVGSNERKTVMRSGSAAQYLPTGHLVYALGTTLLAVPFDIRRLEVRGGPIPVLEQVARVTSAATMSGVAHAVISPSGTLAYAAAGLRGLTGPRILAFVDRGGKSESVGLPPQMYVHPRVSPDGHQLVFAIEDSKDVNIWVYDLTAGGSPRRLTFGGRNLYPIWTRDGRYITFQSDREGDRAVYRQTADGSGAAERLTKAGEEAHEPESWSPDGKVLSMNIVSRGNQGVWTNSFDTGSTPRIFADLTTIVEKHSMFSPDGRWLAYMSNTTLANSNQEIFVQPFPLTAAKYQVTSTGGRTPLWSPDGRQLYFHEPLSNRLLVVDIRTAPSFTVGKPVQLSVQGTIHPIAQRNYDVTPDGKRLLVVLPTATGPTDAPRSSSQQINVVLNWVEELKARVPVTK